MEMSKGRRQEQITLKQHLVEGQVSRMKLKLFHTRISWGVGGGNTRAREVNRHPNLHDTHSNKPKASHNFHEMGFCTVCIFRTFSFHFSVLI